MSTFGARLKKFREQRKLHDPKWTQEYVANLIGVARPTYTAYENGTKEPPLETLDKIADLFETTIDYLHGRTNEPSPTPSNLIEEDDPDVGRAFLGGAKNYTEEEIEIAKAAARAAVEAYRKGRQKGGK